MMLLTKKELREAIRSTIKEAEEENGHEPFPAPGKMVRLIRPVRVTPVAHGEWSDLDTRGVLGWEGGEDSPGSRRASRPRGITATILKPGTQCKVKKSGKNTAIVEPMEDDGSTVVDAQTGKPLDRVEIHINKFCAHCAGVYKAGKPKKIVAPVSTEEQLSAKIAELEKRIKQEKERLASLKQAKNEDE
jgi:hypothetical protein